MQQQSLVQLNGISHFGQQWITRMGANWRVLKITDHVLFSKQPGPWMLLERNHFQRWVSLSSDQHFQAHWAGWC
jgi:hypothetical protein